jgi:LacI family transcriptional regulator
MQLWRRKAQVFHHNQPGMRSVPDASFQSVRERRVPRVALLIETTRTYAREILGGVRRYVAAHGPWSTFIELRSLDSAPPPWLCTWDGDGIITRTFTREMSDLIDATGLPAVEIRSSRECGKRPFIGMDNARIGQAVARHFYDRGFRQFGVYSLRSEAFFEERVQNFITEVHRAGCSCSELPETSSEHIADWEGSQRQLKDWLGGLRKPVGIFAANDQLGVRLLDACQRSGIAVPEEVAIVGAENEETLCNFSSPPLTSVQFDGDSVGYSAAALLDRLMSGESPPFKPSLIAPKGIVIRRSSDEFVINDTLVASAARLIREEAAIGLNVEQLCRRLNVSRTTLDRRMKAALKRTPKEEISRVRFREVERLLRETNLTIDAIAAQTGFIHSHYLQAAFKLLHGCTPGAWRRRSDGLRH